MLGHCAGVSRLMNPSSLPQPSLLRSAFFAGSFRRRRRPPRAATCHAHDPLGQGHGRFKNHADAAGGRESAAAAGRAAGHGRLQGGQGTGRRLRPLCAVASVSKARCRRARAAHSAKNIVGLHAHRSHDEGLFRGNRRPPHGDEFQHHPAVALEDSNPSPIPPIQTWCWNYTRGPSLAIPPARNWVTITHGW